MEDLGIGVAYWTPPVLQGPSLCDKKTGSWRVGLRSPSPPSSRSSWQEKERAIVVFFHKSRLLTREDQIMAAK